MMTRSSLNLHARPRAVIAALLLALQFQPPARAAISPGALPHPHTLAFLGYAPKYIEYLRQVCNPAGRTGYYIEQDGAGNSTGGTGDGTLGNPWKCADVGDVVTLIEAQASAGEVFYLRRSSVWRTTHADPDNTLNLNVDDMAIDAYGVGPEPELRRTTIVSSGWTLVSGTKYTRTETNDVAWVIDPVSDAYLTTPLSRN